MDFTSLMFHDVKLFFLVVGVKLTTNLANAHTRDTLLSITACLKIQTTVNSTMFVYTCGGEGTCET